MPCCRFEPGHYAKARRLECCSFCFALVMVIGVFLATAIHDAVEKFVYTKVVTTLAFDSPTASGYNAFVNSSDPDNGQVLSQFWVYNITNPWDFATGAKPILQQIGPLNYWYNNQKFNVSYTSNNEFVNYREYQYYIPADEATIALQNQQISSINTLLMAALNKGNDVLDDIITLAYPPDDPMSLIINKTISEILWGYSDPKLFNLATFPGYQTNDTSLAYAYENHNFLIVNTGKYDINQMWQYMAWDGMSSLQCCVNGPWGETGSPASGNCQNVWSTPEAERMTGSFGNAWHPLIQPDETLYIGTYDFNILRHWPLQCRNVGSGPGNRAWSDLGKLSANIGGCDSYDVRGISVLNFTLPDWILGNSSVNAAESAGYNINGLSGIMNVSVCEQGAPIFLSLPGFMGGSNALRDAVIGLPEIDFAQHGSWLGIDSVTGKALDFQFRVGINVHVEPMSITPAFQKTVTYFSRVTPLYHPVAWGSQSSTMTASQEHLYKSQIWMGLRVLMAFRWGGIACACFGFIGWVFFKILASVHFRKFKESNFTSDSGNRAINVSDDVLFSGYKAPGSVKSKNSGNNWNRLGGNEFDDDRSGLYSSLMHD